MNVLLSTNARRRFSDAENAVIISDYKDPSIAVETIAEKLERTTASITSQAKRLRSKGLLEYWKAGKGDHWEDWQKDYLRKRWGLDSDQSVANVVGHTVRACGRKANELGFNRTSNRVEDNNGVERCKRGHAFTEANTINRAGGRLCRICRNSWAREYLKERYHAKKRESLLSE